MFKKLNLRRTEKDMFKEGRALYGQKKYSEAKVQFRQAADGQEKTLGRDHEDTLYSRYWLGCALYHQKKYSKAEVQLQQVVDGEERTLGRDYEDTFNSRYWLGLALYDQKKYSEAEVQLQQASDRQERTLGRDHEETLYSKHWLGRALYHQKKYSKAEVQLQQAVDGEERTLGRDHEETLYSKHWLGRALYYQKKYSKAEVQLQQVVDEQERTLSRDYEDTFNSRYWLGLALYDQKKYSEAEVQLQQAADRQERTLGRDHQWTLATLNLLQELKPKLNASSSLPINNAIWQAPDGRLDSFFSRKQGRKESYTDSEINEISLLLNHFSPRWSKVPRTYIVLRTIGHLNLLQDIIDIGFSDFWFPVTKQNLPGCLSPSVCAAFFDAQQIVLTKSIDLEKGEKGKHCHFQQGEPLPFEPKGILGAGGFGQVDKVLSMISSKEYARKRVPRSVAFRGPRKEHIKQFVAEIQLLKRLKHHHIVEFIGSYTDTRYVGLVMSPVAEMDLGAYLTRCTLSNHPELRTFFGCLATALEFLHEQKVRHKDIKPGNILVDHGNVLFADFGLSLDFTDASGSTSTGMTTGMTPRYCAPEVAQHERRNTKSDLWSLGVVFTEMVVVLKGKTVQDMDEFFRQHGSQQTYVRTNMAALPEFVAMLKGIGQQSDNVVFGWTQKMLCAEQESRLSASSLIASIMDSTSIGYFGICCASSEEDFSDWTGE